MAPIHIGIYIFLQLTVAVGAYLSSSITTQFYQYSLLITQLFGYSYVYALGNGQRALSTRGQIWASSIFKALIFVLVLGMALGVINFHFERNEFNLTITYFFLTTFQILALYAGYKCAVYNYWSKMRKVLLIGAVMESIHGLARYVGDSSGYRSSIGLSREGFWTLFYGRRLLFLFVLFSVLFVAITGGMRAAVATVTFYLMLLFLSLGRLRKKVRRRLMLLFLVLAVFVPIGLTTLLSMDRSAFPTMLQLNLYRIELTFSSTPGTTIEDGRSVEWRSVKNEIERNGIALDYIVGRGVGFTYANMRTGRLDSHVHLAVPRIFSRYGYLGLAVFFGGALFISFCSFLEVFKYNRFDIVKLGFLHSFVYFLFFGEDVFMSFWFLFGAALGSSFNSHFMTVEKKLPPKDPRKRSIRLK